MALRRETLEPATMGIVLRRRAPKLTISAVVVTTRG
jgi:hypothetical protein